jgi:transposase
MRIAVPVSIKNDDDRARLLRWSRGRSTPHRLVLRSRIVLMASEGLRNKQIAEELHAHEDTVTKWRNRFAELGMEGIARDAPRPGRRPKLSQKMIDKIIDTTLHTKPSGATHWSTRMLGKHLGISHFEVHRVWKLHRIQPHRECTFKLSRDPDFNERVIDVVGLYMNPPAKAVVMCMDEKPGIQALDRSQTILPLREGTIASKSWEYVRNGTIDLFAALNILDGTVVTQLHKRHRHQEFLIFLREIDEKVPRELDVHMVLDNLGTHDTPEVKRWFERHPRFKLHFTPTDGSWLNLVEAWLSMLTTKQIRRNSFANVRALIDAINEFVAEYQKNPHPFVWTVRADEILRKVARLRELEATGK